MLEILLLKGNLNLLNRNLIIGREVHAQARLCILLLGLGLIRHAFELHRLCNVLERRFIHLLFGEVIFGLESHDARDVLLLGACVILFVNLLHICLATTIEEHTNRLVLILQLDYHSCAAIFYSQVAVVERLLSRNILCCFS